MIIYTVICRDTDGTALVESSTGIAEGNYRPITQELIKCFINNPDTLPDGARKTYKHTGGFGAGGDEEDPLGAGMDGMFKSIVGMGACLGQYNFEDEEEELDLFFHSLRGESLICICLSDDVVGKKQSVNFSFLEDARDEFRKKYSKKKIAKANAYSMEKSFSPELRKLAYYYNTNQKTMSQSEKVKKLTVQVDELKNVMGNNIHLMISRGENLEALADKSDALVEETMVFKKNTKVLKNKMKKRNRMTFIVLGAVAAFFVYLVTAGICGFTFKKCVKS